MNKLKNVKTKKENARKERQSLKQQMKKEQDTIKYVSIASFYFLQSFKLYISKKYLYPMEMKIYISNIIYLYILDSYQVDTLML